MPRSTRGADHAGRRPTRSNRPRFQGLRDPLPGLRAYETRKVVFGAERRIVCTHSQTLHAKRSQGFDQTLAKARRQLADSPPAWLAARPAHPNRRWKPRSPESSNPVGYPG